MFGLLDMSEGAICRINNSQKQTAAGMSDKEAEDSKLEKVKADRQVTGVISASASFSLIRPLVKQITGILLSVYTFSLSWENPLFGLFVFK